MKATMCVSPHVTVGGKSMAVGPPLPIHNVFLNENEQKAKEFMIHHEYTR